MKRGGRESGESGSVAEGTGRDRIAATNPAAQDIERHGYDSREHPFVLRQAERIRALEAENSRYRDIHHEKCSLRKTDHCDCSQNAGRVWIAKALNGCEDRAKQLEDALKACIDETPAYETDERHVRGDCGN